MPVINNSVSFMAIYCVDPAKAIVVNADNLRFTRYYWKFSVTSQMRTHTHTVSEYTLSNSMHHNSRYPWWNDRLVSFCLFSLLCTVSAKPNCAHSDKSWEWNVLRGMRKNNHISLICVRMMMVVCNWCDYNGSSSNVPLFVFCVRQKSGLLFVLFAISKLFQIECHSSAIHLLHRQTKKESTFFR